MAADYQEYIHSVSAIFFILNDISKLSCRLTAAPSCMKEILINTILRR